MSPRKDTKKPGRSATATKKKSGWTDVERDAMKEHARAAEHFRLVQRTPSVTPERHLYATNRLVDLYMGPLDDEGKALVELRKMVERYDGSAVASQARTAIARIKARRAEAT